MEDYTHLRKAHKDDERETLLGKELSPTEAKECLDKIKEISHLIERVRLFPSRIFYLLLYREPLFSSDKSISF